MLETLNKKSREITTMWCLGREEVKFIVLLNMMTVAALLPS